MAVSLLLQHGEAPYQIRNFRQTVPLAFFAPLGVGDLITVKGPDGNLVQVSQSSALSQAMVSGQFAGGSNAGGNCTFK